MKKAFILLSLLPTMSLAQANEGGDALRLGGYEYEVRNGTYTFTIFNDAYATNNRRIGGVIVYNSELETLSNHLIVGVYPEEGGERIDYFDLGEVAIEPQGVEWSDFGYQDLHSLTLPDQPQSLVIGQNYLIRLEDLNTGKFLSETLPLYFCESISIEYTVPESGWGTICLPFSPDYQPEDLLAYYIHDISDDELSLMGMPFFNIGKDPYIVKGTPGTTYTFIGPDIPKGLHSRYFLTGSTECDIYAPKGSYVLQCRDGVTGFYKVQEDNQELVPQYEAYFTPDVECGDFVSLSVKPFDWITAIEGVRVHPQRSDDRRFNIFGTKVSEDYRGIVVRGGKLTVNN